MVPAQVVVDGIQVDSGLAGLQTLDEAAVAAMKAFQALLLMLQAAVLDEAHDRPFQAATETVAAAETVAATGTAAVGSSDPWLGSKCSLLVPASVSQSRDSPQRPEPTPPFPPWTQMSCSASPFSKQSLRACGPIAQCP